MPQPGSEGEQQRRPKFERDFIIVSEFSEQVGPIPIVSDNAMRMASQGPGYVRVCQCVCGEGGDIIKK